jgi:hypothetical protein
MNKEHAAAYAIDHRIRKQPNNSVVVFEQGYGALGEIAELNRAARAEQVARAYGTAMQFAEHK